MEKINIAELLRDCPTGMELDCMIYEDVYFDYIDELNIIHCYIQHDTHKTSITFNQHGTPNSDIKSKCVIFPKGKTTWKGFHRPFRDGDIIYACDDYSDATFTYVAILKRIEKESKGKISYLEIYSHCFYNYEDNYFSTGDLPYDGFDIRFATEKEKADLFKAINDNGYRWDEKTKTLEKLTIFKDGDVIYNKDINALAIFYKQTDASTISYCFLNVLGELRVHHYHSKDLSDWKFATEEEKEKLFKVIKDKGYHWNYETKTLEELPKFKIGNKIRLKKNHNYIYTITGIREKENKYECGVTFILRVSEQDNWELVPDKFDVSKLKPFDKVLVRSDNRHRWSTQFFERLNTKLKDSFVCMGGCRYQQCIPYEGNEHLLDTANECNKFFKVWEE